MPGGRPPRRFDSTGSAGTIRRAAAKARRLAPAVPEVAPGFLVELVEVQLSGSTSCECQAAQHGQYWYHRAAAGLRLGTIPPRFPETEVELQTRRKGSVLATPPGLGRGRLSA